MPKIPKTQKIPKNKRILLEPSSSLAKSKNKITNLNKTPKIKTMTKPEQKKEKF
jgi:hypothetical protein